MVNLANGHLGLDAHTAVEKMDYSIDFVIVTNHRHRMENIYVLVRTLIQNFVTMHPVVGVGFPLSLIN